MFSSGQVDAESGQTDAPRTSRAHMHVITQSLVPQANVCCDFCYPSALISYVGSYFRGCQASKRFSAGGADFMNPKHQMRTHRCFGMACSMKALRKELFSWLSHVAFQGSQTARAFMELAMPKCM
jgi:hypothetical protein